MDAMDPYKVLSIRPGASLEEVKKAYRTMAKRFHPDKYYGSSLESIAEERFKEIQAAYEAILEEMENPSAFRSYDSAGSARTSSSSQGFSAGQSKPPPKSASAKAASQQASRQNAQQAAGRGNFYYSTPEGMAFNEIRLMINQCNYQRAWELLEQMPSKSAEWYFLGGLVAIREGNYERGYAMIQAAIVMDPTNKEYTMAAEHYKDRSTSFTEDYYRYNAGSDIVEDCQCFPSKPPLCCVCIADPFEFLWQLCGFENCIP